jgi:SNF2 family DNA or RNA helicase
VVVDGTPSQRAEQYVTAEDADYIILNYEQVVNDWEYVESLARGFVVCDEATAIKSFRSKRSKYVKKLTSPVKFALTGTPIENGKPEELYSIMQFVDDSVLGRFDIFDQAFIVRNNWGMVDRYRNLPTLHAKMKGAAVRKTQKDPDVAPFLPNAIHNDPIFVSLDRKAAKLYRKIVEDLVRDIETAQEMFGKSFNILSHYGYEGQTGSKADEYRGLIMSKVTCLKMLCSHPDLIKISATKFMNLTGAGSQYACNLVSEGLLDGITSSPKLDLLIQYVKDFLDERPDNKVVIFATYVDMVKMIQSKLGEDISVTYTGQLDAKTKEDNKVVFNTDPNIRVLISSDAGGYGVDLPAANLLINYDLPWSAGSANQRNGRIKRASSTWKTIVIQDLLINGSIEQRQHDALQQKDSVANAVMDGTGIDESGSLELNLGSLREFILTYSV